MDTIRRRLSAARLASLVVPAIGMALWGVWSWQQEYRSSLRYVSQTAAVIALYVERLLEGQEMLLSTITERARGEAPAFLSTEDFQRFLSGTSRANPLGYGIAVIDGSGRFLVSSSALRPDIDAGDRDYRKGILAGADRFVDRIRIQPSNQDALVLARKFQMPGFDGIIVSAMRLEPLTQFLWGVATRPGEAATLARLDGLVLARTALGGTFRLPDTAAGLVSARARPEGTYRTRSVIDGIWRLGAHVNIPRYDLAAFFAVPMRSVWINWIRVAAPVWLLLFVSAGFSYNLFRMLERQINARIRILRESRRAAEAEKLSAQRIHLMREMNHRVKNNLTLIASMIHIQTRRHGAVDGAMIAARIHAIAQVHEMMYDSASGTDVRLGTTLKRLCASAAVIPPERGIRSECRVDEDVTLAPDRSTVLSIAVTELLTNSVKHAFATSPGRISVRLWRDGDEAVIDVFDDGPGLPPDPSRSSGLLLVEALVRQIGGAIERLGPPGARLRIRFPARGEADAPAADTPQAETPEADPPGAETAAPSAH